MIDQFWMVARLPSHAGSKTEPRARYATLAAATDAAATLAAEHNAAFVVLGVVYTAHPRSQSQTSLF